MKLIKKFFSFLILALILPLLIVQTPSSASAALTYQEKAVGFLSDVVGIDLSRYETQLKSYNDYSSYSNSIYDVDATYFLTSEGSQMTAKFYIKDNAKFICSMRDLRGSIFLTQSTTDKLDVAKTFMRRYQSFAGGSYVEPLNQMLQNVTKLENMTISAGDTSLKVECSPVGEDFVTFQWMYTPNGIHNRYTRISLMFEKGAFLQFSDNWNNCVVGSSDVNISEEKAIEIARTHIQAYTYTFGNRTIGNLIVKDDFPALSNLSMQIREANLLYPCWELLVPLNETYPGFVTAMHLYLWADTGKLALIEKSGGGGGSAIPESLDEAFPNTQDATAIPKTNGNQASSAIAFVATSVVVALLLGTAIVAFKPKRKN